MNKKSKIVWLAGKARVIFLKFDIPRKRFIRYNNRDVFIII